MCDKRLSNFQNFPKMLIAQLIEYNINWAKIGAVKAAAPTLPF